MVKKKELFAQITNSTKVRKEMQRQALGKISKYFQSNVGASLKPNMIHITALKMEVNALVRMVMCSMVPSTRKDPHQSWPTLKMSLNNK
jgi:hypothetical protein